MAATRDISASGMYLEIDASLRVGTTTSLAVQMETPSGPLMLRCEGEIVRVEPRGERMGVALKILTATMEMLEAKASKAESDAAAAPHPRA